MSVLEQVAAESAEHAARYTDLVARLGRGDDVEAGLVRDIIAKHNVKLADLQAAVAKEKRLNALREQVAAADAGNERLPALRDKVAELCRLRDEEIAAVRQRCADEGAPIEAEIQEITARNFAAESARSELARLQPRVTPEQFEQHRAQQQAAVAALAPPPAPARNPDPTGWQQVQPGVIH